MKDVANYLAYTGNWLQIHQQWRCYWLLTPLNCIQMHYYHFQCVTKTNFSSPKTYNWRLTFLLHEEARHKIYKRKIYKNHYLVVSWQACVYQNEKLFHREWCRRSLTLIVSSYLEKYITTKTTSCNSTVLINWFIIIYQIFWTQTCPEEMCPIRTQVPCEVPSLANPTTRKGWPHHCSLRPLLFSNSGEIMNLLMMVN